MGENPLKVVSVSATKSKREQETAKFESLWKEDPEQFDPTRNIQERERLERTEELLKNPLPSPLHKSADLGCGSGAFTKRLAALCPVDAVDISTLALQHLQSVQNIAPIQDYVPHTSLPDDTYDLVSCLELIAYLPQEELRLLFSELSRLLTPEGKLLCSTPLDMHSEDPLQRFAYLAEKEFVIEKWVFSWHRLYIHVRNFFEAPARFVRASQDPHYRAEQLDQRRGLSRFWFQLNSLTLFSYPWRLIRLFSRPLASAIRQSPTLLLFLERICRLIWSDSGITHALFIGKKRPIEFTPLEEQPHETKHKKQLWE